MLSILDMMALVFPGVGQESVDIGLSLAVVSCSGISY